MTEGEKEAKMVCKGCSEQESGDDGPGKDTVPKVRMFNSMGNAELLAKIHRVKTGHDPEVRPVS